MKWILCSDWLPERARWAYLACLGLPALLLQKQNSLMYHISQLKAPGVYSKKNRQFWPCVYLKPEFNWGLAFISEVQFSVIFSGWFIVTDIQRPKGSLSRQFLHFYGPWLHLRPYKCKNSNHLDRTSLVNNAYTYMYTVVNLYPHCTH